MVRHAVSIAGSRDQLDSILVFLCPHNDQNLFRFLREQILRIYQESANQLLQGGSSAGSTGSSSSSSSKRFDALALRELALPVQSLLCSVGSYMSAQADCYVDSPETLISLLQDFL